MALTALELLEDEDLTKGKQHERATWLGTVALAWGALGVIYGDIGTSPLYVYATIFASRDPSKDDVLGAVSLIFWTITSIVLVKYVGIVLLADDDGEGGTFSLYSLLCRNIGIRPHAALHAREDSRLLRGLSTARPSVLVEGSQRRAWWTRLSADGSAVRRALRSSRSGQLVLWGMTMAATGMVLGDGVLTPAISVMSAVSGLKEASPSVSQQTVVGVSIAILVLLYSVQQLGTHRVSSSFAPIVALWLAANCGVAIYNLSRYGGAVFAGLSPHHIVTFFARHGAEAWRMLGGVMLCVTGAEALYADLGHFSRDAILLGFASLVYPCLVLTYLGQGAYLMHHPEDVGDTFWKSVPKPFFYPMLVIATLASIVASQALITGSFSIIANAIKLGAFPKLHIVHTSRKVRGQIYVGEINWTLLILCIAVVAGFKDTVALGNAYGLTVSSVFLITTALVAVVMVAVWEVSLLAVVPFTAFFLLIEGAFVSANLIKVPEGGWFTLAVSSGVCYVMLIWWAGTVRRTRLMERSGGGNDLTEIFCVMQQQQPLAPASLPLSGMPSAVAAGAAVGEAAAPPPAVGAASAFAVAAAAPIAAIAAANSPPSPTLAALRAASIARLSMWRPVELALRAPNGELCLLSRQPGIGIYYSESPTSLPHVLLHFLTNVHAMHDVSVFLTVRVVPLPHVQPQERLLVRQLRSIPNFYQVVARYGYLDKVDHGPQFVSRVVDAIVKALRRTRREQQQQQRGRRDVQIEVAPDEEAGGDGGDEFDGLEADIEPPRTSAVETAEPLQARSPPAAASEPADVARGSAPRLERSGGATGLLQQPSLGAVDENAVAHILEARKQGVVYYFGSVRVRADPRSPIAHQLLFGAVYRGLLMLSYSEVEDWQVPADHVVDLGMILRI